MIYGTLCFATLFSFVGTVLGGLWADDSWGRFWGWDPKENGALIIVLWNVLVLHARWGGAGSSTRPGGAGGGGQHCRGLVLVRGERTGSRFALLRLHRRRVADLGIFVISQLAIIGIGLLPTHVVEFPTSVMLALLSKSEEP